jgi:SAM-dependent MidA family methyltransferase
VDDDRGPAFGAVAERVGRVGPVPFGEFVEAALSGPEGFFTRGGGAGRRADFLTSPEVGPLFGAVVLAPSTPSGSGWGAPDPFVVVEAGAGRGALAKAVLDARPACAPALRYVLAERSPVLRAAAEQLLVVEPAANVLGGVGEVDGPAPAGTGTGPVVAVLDDLPAATFPGVILANELLDNLPFDLVERSATGWEEVRVGVRGDRLVEVLVVADAGLTREATSLAPDAPGGARIPVQQGTRAWLARALSLLVAGRVVVIDYADVTASLAARPWHEWLRTYRGHGRAGHPLEAPGTADITCEVAVDQLAAVRAPDLDRPQAGWLDGLGIGLLVDDAKERWRAGAHVGDLAALAARSRVGEADALRDPDGLGAFRVLEWQVG